MGVLQILGPPHDTAQPDRSPVFPSGTDATRVSADGARAWMCGDDGAVMVPISRPTQSKRLGTGANCLSIDGSAEGLLGATAYSDGHVQAWSASGEPFTPRLPHGTAVMLVGFLPDSRKLLTVDGDGLIRLWDVAASAPWTRVNRGYTWMTQFSPDGRRLALASGSSSPPLIGQATLLDSVTGEMLLPPLRHGGNGRHVQFSPDGTLIASASDDGTARLWDAGTGEPVSPVLRHDAGSLATVVFSPDGRRLVTFGNSSPSSSNATLWEVPSGRRLATFPDTASAVFGEFSPDGQLFMTAAPHARRILLWRMTGEQPVLAMTWSPYTAAAFLSNSEIALAATRSLEVRGLDGTVVRQPVAITQGLGIVITKDQATLVLAADTGALHVVTARDLAPRFPALLLPGSITAAEVSRDNRWLVASSWERRTRAWSIETGEPLTPERSVPLLPLSASFSPDGSRMQVGGFGATIWDLKPDTRPVATLERIAQLRSGHELAGTQLVPVPAQRLLDLARDPQTAQAIPPAVERKWAWMVVNQHLSRGNWSAVMAALAPLLADPNASWEVHSTHGQAQAELGRWAEAQRAFRSALARRPEWTQLIYDEALARAAGGEQSAIDEACAAALQTFGTTRNPDRAHWVARLCVLSSTLDDTGKARVRDLAQMVVDIEGDIGRHVGIYAAALVRANDFAQAEKLLLALMAPPQFREREEEAQLILAYAQRQLGRTRDSQATLARYQASASIFMRWERRIEAETWRRLAEGRE